MASAEEQFFPSVCGIASIAKAFGLLDTKAGHASVQRCFWWKSFSSGVRRALKFRVGGVSIYIHACTTDAQYIRHEAVFSVSMTRVA